MHAKSGGNLEIMGLLQGKIMGDTFVVIDAFALPVEGTETRVNAQAEAYEYMIDFAETNKVSNLTQAVSICNIFVSAGLQQCTWLGLEKGAPGHDSC